ncbi:heterotrimeric G-protein alpha subunit, GPA3-like protein [Coprinopsis sp. MPI-PUGE-AT-0042]|nr:heterotrimeric G-protein alpha subunit, GPA3-like protein [Coprinopsis sp. MPI-PUGE-AT-0042]
MGGQISVVDQKAAKARSDEIDEQIKEDRKRFNRECNVLLMGTDRSGMSTLVKHMAINHQGEDSLSEADLTAFRPVVYKNVIESAQEVLTYMVKARLNWVNGSNWALTHKVLESHLTMRRSDAQPYLPLEIAEAIDQLWQDPIMPRIMDELYDHFDMMDDNVGYFLSQVRRISQPDYLPNEMDVSRARQMLVGISEKRFTMDQWSIRLIDVSRQRNERKKWIHCFESVTSVLFCTALSGYEQTTRTNNHELQNRMTESLLLFESMVNSRWFLRSSIILFLTKIDVFKKKLQEVPLEYHFPKYTSGTDVNKATKFILSKFMQANRARLFVYPQYVFSFLPTAPVTLGTTNLCGTIRGR